VIVRFLFDCLGFSNSNYKENDKILSIGTQERERYK
jgi:hypothetical protein